MGSWKQRLVALVGIIGSLGLIASGVLWLYSDVSLEARWTDFVESSALKVVAAADTLEEARELLEVAEGQEVGPSKTAPLMQQMLATEHVLTQAESISEYIQIDVGVERDSDEKPDQVVVSDPLETLRAPLDRSAILLPADVDTVFPLYRDLMNGLEEHVFELDEAMDRLEAEVDQTLAQAHKIWSKAVKRLQEVLNRALSVLEESDPGVVGPEEWTALWDLAAQADKTLEMVQGVNHFDAMEMEEAAEQAEDMSDRLVEAFDPYFNPAEEVVTVPAPVVVPQQAPTNTPSWTERPGNQTGGGTPVAPPETGNGGGTSTPPPPPVPPAEPDPEPGPGEDKPDPEPGPGEDKPDPEPEPGDERGNNPVLGPTGPNDGQ